MSISEALKSKSRQSLRSGQDIDNSRVWTRVLFLMPQLITLTKSDYILEKVYILTVIRTVSNSALFGN